MIERTAHELKGNLSTKFPQKVIYFDAESYLHEHGNIITHEPYLIIGCYVNYNRHKEEWYTAQTTLAFWSWVLTKVNSKERLICFAHNITYDFIATAGFIHLFNAGYEITSMYENGRTFILSFRQGDKKIIFLNTGNYYQGTVAALGKAFGFPKLEMDFENPTLSQAIPYCKRDVEIIKVAMEKWFIFCKENDLGTFAKTCPSQAFNAYRHRFMEYPIFIHDNFKAIELERLCYYGGRVECGFIGERNERIYDLDVNSMYPFVMLEYTFPTKLVTFRVNVTIPELKKLLKKYLVCAKVRVKTRIPFYPYRIADKLIFPIGEFTTYLSTPELENAITNNHLIEIYQLAVYEHKPIFKSYVNFFYTERLKAKEAGNEANDLLYKLMMNSLYGKFGQKAGGWIMSNTDREGVGYETVYNADTDQLEPIKWIYGKEWRRCEEGEGYNSFVAVAAHVTAYARVCLYGYANIAGRKNVYYMDTDSLFVNEIGYQNLLTNNLFNNKTLGKLKLECTVENLKIHCPKDYQLGEQKKCKGVPGNAKQIGENTWEVLIWGKVSTFIRAGNLGEYFNIKRQKTLQRTYNKGIVTESGIVEPFNITEGVS